MSGDGGEARLAAHLQLGHLLWLVSAVLWIKDMVGRVFGDGGEARLAAHLLLVHHLWLVSAVL